MKLQYGLVARNRVHSIGAFCHSGSELKLKTLTRVNQRTEIIRYRVVIREGCWSWVISHFRSFQVGGCFWELSRCLPSRVTVTRLQLGVTGRYKIPLHNQRLKDRDETRHISSGGPSIGVFENRPVMLDSLDSPTIAPHLRVSSIGSLLYSRRNVSLTRQGHDHEMAEAH